MNVRVRACVCGKLSDHNNTFQKHRFALVFGGLVSMCELQLCCFYVAINLWKSIFICCDTEHAIKLSFCITL